MLLQPHKGGERKTGKCPVPEYLSHLPEAQHMINGLQLFPGTLVQPEDGRAEGLPVTVHHNDSMHLA